MWDYHNERVGALRETERGRLANSPLLLVNSACFSSHDELLTFLAVRLVGFHSHSFLGFYRDQTAAGQQWYIKGLSTPHVPSNKQFLHSRICPARNICRSILGSGQRAPFCEFDSCPRLRLSSGDENETPLCIFRQVVLTRGWLRILFNFHLFDPCHVDAMAFYSFIC
jgi:hypothetical protein